MAKRTQREIFDDVFDDDTYPPLVQKSKRSKKSTPSKLQPNEYDSGIGVALIEIPEDAGSEEYMSALIENTLRAYSIFLSHTKALDFVEVPHKVRALVLENPMYRIKAGKIRATKQAEEIREINELSRLFSREKEPDALGDPRDPKSMKAADAARKEWLAMKLNVAKMRRDLLQMSREDDQINEIDSINIYIVPVTQKELMALVNIEVHEGEDTSDVALQGPSEENPLASVMSHFAVKVKDEITSSATIQEGYVIDPETGEAYDL